MCASASGLADSDAEDGSVEPGVLNVALLSGRGHLFSVPNRIVGGLIPLTFCTGYLT